MANGICCSYASPTPNTLLALFFSFFAYWLLFSICSHATFGATLFNQLSSGFYTIKARLFIVCYTKKKVQDSTIRLITQYYTQQIAHFYCRLAIFIQDPTYIMYYYPVVKLNPQVGPLSTDLLMCVYKQSFALLKQTCYIYRMDWRDEWQRFSTDFILHRKKSVLFHRNLACDFF